MNKFSKLKIELSKEEILKDYSIALLSRNLSLLGRKEVLTGKGKFGIFGDGKEVAQLAMAKTFKNGDFRSGYYRDQTFMMAAGIFKAEEFFAQIYGDTDLKVNPAHGGRLMNNHFATRSLNEDGSWKRISEQKNSSADISPTAGQMPRLLGLAYASKLYRNNKELHKFTEFSNKGNEVAFGTIGDASTSEGHFFETMNAAGVLQVPFAMSVWDDDYGISVAKKYQTTKQSISELLKGFEKNDKDGFIIYKAKGWDYPGLVNTYYEGVKVCREEHIPVLFHIEEMTQPQGHSTSGSHERYKSEERLAWEKEFDPITKMREWIIQEKIAPAEELDILETEAKELANETKKKAWQHFTKPLKSERDELAKLIETKTCVCHQTNDLKIKELKISLKKELNPIKKTNISTARKILREVCQSCAKTDGLKYKLNDWLKKKLEEKSKLYSDSLYNDSADAVIHQKSVQEIYPKKQVLVNGREILRDNFDTLFTKHPLLVTFGEDTGGIGG
jgi:2-oxoisovalerate dehydrogenase E1 component